MKRKAIHAELRKESKTFEGWLKYEVTIQEEDGKTSKVPAYGKDLQDALSRVVHDEKVEKLPGWSAGCWPAIFPGHRVRPQPSHHQTIPGGCPAGPPPACRRGYLAGSGQPDQLAGAGR